jgi:Transposase DDE domain
MARRGEAVHVATTSRTYKGKTYQTHLLRRTYREGGKVKHQTLGNLSHLPPQLVEVIRRALRGEAVVPAAEAFEIQRSLPHGHVAAGLAMLRQLGLDRLLASASSRHRELIVAMIIARLVRPCSKLATARGLDAPTSSLAEILDLGTTDEEELYQALDWLLQRQPAVQTALARRHLEEGSLVLYDVTSTYFEGRCCPLARLGHSRDGRHECLQIVFGLLTNAQGCPVAVEVFAGDTGDPTTLASQVDKLRHQFGLQRIVVVGDRGLITEARLREDLRPKELWWITALRAPAIARLVAEGSLQLSLFDQRDLAEITDPRYPGERLVVCKNPLLAAERGRKREDLLKATERELDKIVKATARPRNPLRGKDRIGLRVGAVLGRFKVAKHFRLDLRDDGLHYERNHQAIAQEAAVDGLYVLRTPVPVELLSTEQTVEAYKSLAAVERAFRSLKTVDLRVRPIYHRLASRVRAHVFLCMLAYYVEWHMRRRLAPLLFDDEHPAAGKARRSSVVAPARRSVAAEVKALTRTTADGTLPVQSFHGLLDHLATLCKNQVIARTAGGATFYQYSLPTPLQQRAFELLGVSYSV